MPGTTTNFGFPYPLDTDALADGAQEIENLATDLDTTFVDLKGGTTDQLLAKNSNTDMDFKWVAKPADPIVTHIAIRTADATTSGTQVVFETPSDVFTFGLNKQYYVSGQVTFSKASTTGAESISLDFNFNNVAYGDIKWSFVTNITGDAINVNRANNNLTSDIERITQAATTGALAYSCVFEGIIRTDATNTLTMTPQLVGSAAFNITVQDYGCFMRVEEWGTKGDKEAGAGGWS
jgi:hypothetical protein